MIFLGSPGPTRVQAPETTRHGGEDHPWPERGETSGWWKGALGCVFVAGAALLTYAALDDGQPAGLTDPVPVRTPHAKSGSSETPDDPSDVVIAGTLHTLGARPISARATCRSRGQASPTAPSSNRRRSTRSIRASGVWSAPSRTPRASRSRGARPCSERAWNRPEGEPARANAHEQPGRIHPRPLKINAKDTLWKSRRYQLTFTAEGYYDESAYFRMGEDREVMLVIPGSLLGVAVLEGTDVPVANAKIMLTGEKFHHGFPAVTGPDGRFRYADLKPGTYRLLATPEKNPPLEQSNVVVRSRLDTRVLLEVEEGVKVHGKVTDQLTGAAIHGAMVFTVGEREADADRSRRNLPDRRLPRAVTVKVFKPGYMPRHVPIKAKKEEKAQHHDVTLLRPGTVHAGARPGW